MVPRPTGLNATCLLLTLLLIRNLLFSEKVFRLCFAHFMINKNYRLDVCSTRYAHMLQPLFLVVRFDHTLSHIRIALWLHYM